MSGVTATPPVIERWLRVIENGDVAQLDEMLAEDNAASIKEMIVKPNIEIVKGYSKGVMPANYASTLSKAQLDALVKYIDQSVHGKG